MIYIYILVYIYKVYVLSIQCFRILEHRFNWATMFTFSYILGKISKPSFTQKDSHPPSSHQISSLTGKQVQSIGLAVQLTTAAKAQTVLLGVLCKRLPMRCFNLLWTGAGFRFNCLCICSILNHFRRCFSCFLQTSDISSCTLQQNDFHWLEQEYIFSACYFMWSASYMDMYTTVKHCKCLSKDYYRHLHSFTKTNQPRVLEWHGENLRRLRRCVT